jgi:glycine cleavage system H protein
VIPEDLKYTEAHEWVRVAEDGGPDGAARVGITDYAQRQLGDVVFVQLPEVGQRVAAGDAVGEIESTKSVSDLFAPVAGEVIAVNDALTEQPELLNSAPYREGWIFDVRLEEPGDEATAGLLDAAAYRSLTDQT